MLWALWVSHSAPACKGLQTFSFILLPQHRPREHTHTLKHYKHRFPVSLGTISPPFPGFLPKITKVTFSKANFFFFFFFKSRRGECWKIGMARAVFRAEPSRMSLWILFLKITQVEMIFWKLMSHSSTTQTTSTPGVTKSCYRSMDCNVSLSSSLCLSICFFFFLKHLPISHLPIYSKEHMFSGAALRSGYSSIPLRSDVKPCHVSVDPIRECQERGVGGGWR